MDLKPSHEWRLQDARAAAAALLEIKDTRLAVRQLLKALAGPQPALRVRAADVLRRVTEKDSTPLLPHASALASILSDVPIAEKRALWHLGLVVARVARTPSQIRVAAGLMWQLSEDSSNVVRCSAVEGLSMLALRDRTLRSSVEAMLHHALLTGTPAMRCRARDGLQRLQRATESASRLRLHR